MSSTRIQPPAISRMQSVLAWFLMGLVFTLSLLTASPEIHAYLHGESRAHSDDAVPQAHDDHSCAVTLFQQGVTTPLDLPRVDTPRNTLWIATLPPARDTLALSAPRHLLRPARGPPCIG